jgi:hypothetical protein
MGAVPNRSGEFLSLSAVVGSIANKISPFVRKNAQKGKTSLSAYSEPVGCRTADFLGACKNRQLDLHTHLNHVER